MKLTDSRCRCDSDDDKPVSSKMYGRKLCCKIKSSENLRSLEKSNSSQLMSNINSSESLNSLEKSKSSKKKKRKKKSFNQESNCSLNNKTNTRKSSQKNKYSHYDDDDDYDECNDELCNCTIDKKKRAFNQESNCNVNNKMNTRKSSTQKKKYSHYDDDDDYDEFNKDKSCNCTVDKKKKDCSCDEDAKRKNKMNTRKSSSQKKKSSNYDDDDDDYDKFKELQLCNCTFDEMKRACSCDDDGNRKKPCFCAAKMNEIRKRQSFNYAAQIDKAKKSCDCNINSCSAVNQSQRHSAFRNEDKSRHRRRSSRRLQRCDQEDDEEEEDEEIAHQKHVKKPQRNERSARRQETEQSFWSSLNCCGGKSRTQSTESITSEEYEILPSKTFMHSYRSSKNRPRYSSKKVEIEICPYCHGQVDGNQKSRTAPDLVCTCSSKRTNSKQKSKKRSRNNRTDWESPKVKNVYGGGRDNYFNPGHC